MLKLRPVPYLSRLFHFLRPLFPQTVVNYLYHLPQAALAANLYGNPGRDLEIIGVTGTDGKTTTATLIYHILKTAKKKVALISTVDARVGRKKLKTGLHVTSPNPFALQSLLRRMRSQKIRYVVLEVTSHGLDQFRIYPLHPKIAVLTNVTHEHLDYHRTFAKYLTAKLKLFRSAKHAVINKDLALFPEINERLHRVLFSTYSLITDSQLKPDQVTYLQDGTSFTLGGITYYVPLPGEYNLYNTLAAISTTLLLEVSPSEVKRALASFPGVTGRLEKIDNRRGLHTYVDFAHTPNALRQVLLSLKAKKRDGENLIVVFGAAGLRDSSKRPLMGVVAGELADRIVLTSEDPRSESASVIAEQILAGIPPERRRDVTIELDRTRAIDYAVNHLAKRGDWVVTCGKGHEESMNLDGVKETPWSEHQTLKLALAQKL